MRLLLLAAFLTLSASAFAQDNALALMRQDIKTQKVEIMGASLPLTDSEAAAFWPIYRDYDHQLSKLGDRRIAVIKKVFASYETMDEATAQKLVKESFAIAKNRTNLLEKYYTKISKNIGTVTAARWLQIENEMLTILDAQIIDEVPLVKIAPAKKQEMK
jgi:hypothetical protein